MIQDLPVVNATLNGIAFVLILMGFVAIRRKQSMVWHRFFMLSAVGVSAAFLASYLTYHFGADAKSYTGSVPYFYYSMLITHVILAAAVPVLVGLLLFFAFREEFTRHKQLARWTFPIWAYVSVTGVLVFYFVHIN